MKGKIRTIIVILSLVLSACSVAKNPTTSSTPKAPDPMPVDSSPTSGENNSSTTSPINSINPSDDVENLLSKLTLKEKIGQMFFIASRTNGSAQYQLAMDERLKNNLNQFVPGGFILFTENLDTIPQTVSFIQSIQKNAKIPLFIGIDEEGGVVTRLNRAEKLHSTVMPEPYTIGLTKNKSYAFQASQAISEEIKSLGFNLNFAPVADVFSNSNNRIIGRRAYANDGLLASEMVSEAVKGAQKSGIIPVLKHFPGHGDTLQDSHTGAAIVENSLERLKKVELLPFMAGIEAGAEMVMTAHVLTPQITDNGLPATLSQPILQGILREQLGFDGIIITDGLEMSAISSFYPEEEAVVLAVQAGVDMLLLPKDLKKAYNAILLAVQDDRISEQRIDESVRRILKLKIKTIINEPIQNIEAEKVLGSQQHRDLADQIGKDSKP